MLDNTDPSSPRAAPGPITSEPRLISSFPWTAKDSLCGPAFMRWWRSILRAGKGFEKIAKHKQRYVNLVTAIKPPSVIRDASRKELRAMVAEVKTQGARIFARRLLGAANVGRGKGRHGMSPRPNQRR